jgi:hypothetical protein
VSLTLPTHPSRSQTTIRVTLQLLLLLVLMPLLRPLLVCIIANPYFLLRPLPLLLLLLLLVCRYFRNAGCCSCECSRSWHSQCACTSRLLSRLYCNGPAAAAPAANKRDKLACCDTRQAAAASDALMPSARQEKPAVLQGLRPGA